MLTRQATVLAFALTACTQATTHGTTTAAVAQPQAEAGAQAPATPPGDDDDAAGIIGASGLSWDVSQWFNSPPIALSDLRGKVVFVRWFMSPECPFCSGTAPALRELHEKYAGRGLAVVGMYHHKEKTPLDPEQVRGWIKHFGYDFPVAIDKDWTTLKRWWLDGHQRTFTSVSFLLDRDGVVRYVHTGGLIDPRGQEFKDLEARVEKLLAQRVATGSSR